MKRYKEAKLNADALESEIDKVSDTIIKIIKKYHG